MSDHVAGKTFLEERELETATAKDVISESAGDLEEIGVPEKICARSLFNDGGSSMSSQVNPRAIARYLHKAHGLSWYDIAGMLGVRQEQVRKWING